MKLAAQIMASSGAQEAAAAPGEAAQVFLVKPGGSIHHAKHIRYFMSCLKGLTYHYAGNDQNRLMVVSCVHCFQQA